MKGKKRFGHVLVCIGILFSATGLASGPADGLCQLILAGDLNRDCKVDMDDMALFASAWLTDLSGQPGAFLPAGIFVAPPESGGYDQSACGSMTEPCATIGYGIGRAVSEAYSYVFVSDGVYSETVTMTDGISVVGGFDRDTWVRGVLDQSNTVLVGGMVGGYAKTLIADSIIHFTELSGFVIWGADATAAGGNSYTVWIHNSSSNFVLKSNQIHAGRGANGSDGLDGTDGLSGANGAAGLIAKDTVYKCFETCQGLGETAGGAGGILTCGQTNVNGGNGGTAACPDWNETVNNCTNCSGSENQSLTFAADGAGSGGGQGGQDGLDGYIDFACKESCNLYVPTAPMDGQDGQPGDDGVNGAGGSGASSAVGIVVSNEWTGVVGFNGANGIVGSGGGGGGAGGGVEHRGSDSCGYGRSDVGGSGGGGGSGGCGGDAGAGGSAGGGSFGIFVVNTVSSSDRPTLLYNLIYGGLGGAGGDGGFGGKGSLGGLGGAGGAGGTSGTYYWGAGAGGKGGDGDAGGQGGGGGGGAGGVSYGLYTWNITGVLNYHLYNNFNAPPVGGIGGKGGKSFGNDGDNGPTGDVANYIYH